MASRSGGTLIKASGEGNHAWRCLLGGALEAKGNRCSRVSVIVAKKAETCAPLREQISVARFWRAESVGADTIVMEVAAVWFLLPSPIMVLSLCR